MSTRSVGLGADGTIEMDGQQLQLRLVDDNLYLKADESFWADNANAEIAKLMVGRWFMGSADDPQTASFAQHRPGQGHGRAARARRRRRQAGPGQGSPGRGSGHRRP